MSHTETQVEYKTFTERFSVSDNSNDNNEMEDIGPDPGHVWDILDIRASLHASGTGSAGQFTRWVNALQVGFLDQVFISTGSLDTVAADELQESDRLLYYDVAPGVGQVVDTTDGAGAGGHPVDLSYREVFSPGDLQLPYPGELAVFGQTQNDLGGGTMAVEGWISLSLKYQDVEVEEVPAHGVPVR